MLLKIGLANKLIYFIFIWKGSAPTKCSKPDVPVNGYVRPHKNSFEIGELVWYNCSPGFTLNGAADIVCRRDGTWSHPAPTCDRDVSKSCHERCGSYDVKRYSCQCAKLCWWKRNCCHDFRDICLH